MPFKFHEPHRHRVPKARYRVRNWAEYDRGLVQRGDVRVWISAEALACWKAACRSTPGGQRRFSNLAVETVLVLGALYKLPLRQTEGFVRSLIALMRLELTVPDHTTLARRRRTMQTTEFRWPRTKPVDIVIDSTGLKFHGAGEWARAKHGESRRSWRKLHISVNPDDNEIIAFELTDDDTSDAAMIGDLVAASGGNIRAVIADGAYDGEPTYTPFERRDHPDRRRRSSSHRKRHRSRTRAILMAAASANAMPPRLPDTAEWPGSGDMATARDHWPKPHSPGSRPSTTGASPREPSAPSRTRSPFTSRSPTETC